MYKSIYIVTILTFAITILLFMVVGKANIGHLEEELCSDCHLTSGSVKPENAHQLVSSQELLCKRCHPKELVVSHPTGFVPNRKIPEIYPLDWKGELTCSSCHDIHGVSSGLMRTASRGRDYCLSCHESAFFDQMADLGTTLMKSGHLGSSSSADLIYDNIDSYSLECLDCHSNRSDELFVSVSSAGIVNHTSERANHPIGREYQQAISFGGYRPVEQIPEHILLPEGKVSCVSCHEGYSQEHGKLVESGTGSRLCLHCHDL